MTPNYDSNRSSSVAPKPVATSAPNPSVRPPYGSSSGGPFQSDDKEELTQKEIEERLWEQKCEQLFHGVNSIDDLITVCIELVFILC